jgi:alpha-galactosidase
MPIPIPNRGIFLGAIMSSNRFNVNILGWAIGFCFFTGSLLAETANPPLSFGNLQCEIRIVGQANLLWEYRVKTKAAVFQFLGPEFEIGETHISGGLAALHLAQAPVPQHNGTLEYTYEGSFLQDPALQLRMVFRLAKDNPVVRFRYELRSSQPRRLSKSARKDFLNYFAVSFQSLPSAREVLFSEFNEQVHSFCLSEREIKPADFENSLTPMGPLMAGFNSTHSFLLGYEHGSQVPDAFLHFALGPLRQVTLQAVKGNYCDGQEISPAHPFETLWMETAAVAGDEKQLAQSYRSFVLKDMSQNLESRKPYIFYNTWNYQERQRNWNKRPYLESMNLSRMLEEIEVAHQMGIEVFVLDTGWYEKTGDWKVDLRRFPDNLKQVKAKLDQYGMKLGLWFNPTAAAISSQMLAKYPDCIKTTGGKADPPYPVWETEESRTMCLVSRYREGFANALIRLARELGVTYFKWDAIGQYGCDDPGHQHGTSANSPQERSESYAFQLSRSMAWIVNRLSEACPEAIVDFDITEGGRSVGLEFLAASKYFLVNNGPYYFNYDIPFDREKDNWNIFFYPGPARGWICRTPLTYDKWFPSVLFLTHYLPDDPYENQAITVGSLILGQNGIWGDLPKISKEGVSFIHEALEQYKMVRDDMTQASLLRIGGVGGNPEIYEKINPTNGQGAMVVFASHPGHYVYISESQPAHSLWKTKGVEVSFDAKGRARLDLDFTGADAKIICFKKGR